MEKFFSKITLADMAREKKTRAEIIEKRLLMIDLINKECDINFKKIKRSDTIEDIIEKMPDYYFKFIYNVQRLLGLNCHVRGTWLAAGERSGRRASRGRGHP